MFRGVVLAFALMAVAAACGDDDAPNATLTTSPSPTASGGATSSLAALRTPTFRPVTGGIAYAGEDGGLWLMDAEGSDVREIYRGDAGYAYHPEWSPNGTRPRSR